MDYIRRLTERYWATEVRTAEFVRIAAGKEIGHKIGDMVDEKTTRLLKDCGRFDIRHQQSRGQAAGRSMGDLWLEAGFIYNPVNIKAGEYGRNGQPNLVSLKRVLVALAGCLIDSYYLLIMKVGQTASGYEPHVYFVDMLDFLDYTVFNSGPGQSDDAQGGSLLPSGRRPLRRGPLRPRAYPEPVREGQEALRNA